MTSILKWVRLTALGGLRVVHNAMLDGKQVGQVSVSYRAAKGNRNSNSLPVVKEYTAWGGGSYKSLREAKRDVELQLWRKGTIAEFPQAVAR